MNFKGLNYQIVKNIEKELNIEPKRDSKNYNKKMYLRKHFLKILEHAQWKKITMNDEDFWVDKRKLIKDF